MAFLIHILALLLRGLVAVHACVLPGLALAASLPSVNREPEIKAAALLNIIAFTDWPTAAFPSSDAPLVIGVLGQGPVASVLGPFVANERWHGRTITLRRLGSTAEATGCHVLYLARSEHTHWLVIRAQLPREPLLTVCDGEDFARQGGIVQFAVERNKLHLTVNLAAARASGLAISSKVLRLAEVIDDPMP